MSTMSEKYIGILGGSFNPPHIGHMRMAMEAAEVLNFDEIWFMPCGVHPQKPASGMLSFDFRKKMLQETIKILPNAQVCDIENELSVPSYTVDTLRELKKRFCKKKFAFILGCEDFMALPTWSRWQTLPSLADLVVLPRDQGGWDDFAKTAKTLWPDGIFSTHKPSGASVFYPSQEEQIIYVEQPKLEISSSLIRKRFIEQRSIDFLVTDSVYKILSDNKSFVTATWKESSYPRD